MQLDWALDGYELKGNIKWLLLVIVWSVLFAGALLGWVLYAMKSSELGYGVVGIGGLWVVWFVVFTLRFRAKWRANMPAELAAHEKAWTENPFNLFSDEPR